MVAAGNHKGAVEMLCGKFHISIAHADEIVMELDDYQWHVEHDPKLDKEVKKLLAEHNIVGAAKHIRSVHEHWGLLECKLYMEDIQNGSKPWPKPMADDGSSEELLKEIFGVK